MSNSRRQIEAWLKTIDVSGSVLDIGGLFWPVKGRTKSWNVPEYKILDVKSHRKGVIADYVFDLNRTKLALPYAHFENAFCIEVTDHFWNPITAFLNISATLKQGANLYISSNFLFPHHTGLDCARFTRTGLSKILSETSFEVLEITPRIAYAALASVMAAESKVDYAPDEIGYMIKARRI